MGAARGIQKVNIYAEVFCTSLATFGVSHGLLDTFATNRAFGDRADDHGSLRTGRPPVGCRECRTSCESSTANGTSPAD